MQKRALFIASIFVLGMTGVAAAESIDAVSTVKSSVVYPSSARITRTAKVSLKEGTHTIKLKAVQPNFDENSLSVSGKGTATAKILGAGMKTEFLKETSDDRVRELGLKIQGVDDELAGLRGQASALAEKKAFIDSIKLFSKEQLPKDLVTKVPTAEELKATLSFIEGESTSYEEAAQALQVKTRELTKTRQALANELNKLRSSGGAQEQVLAVDVECEKAGDLELEIAYTVMAASWYPLYEARVDFEKSKTILSAFAVAQQTAGEDWTDVQLTLSTSMPAVGGRMPELTPWYLMPSRPRPPMPMFNSLGGGMEMKRGMMMKAEMAMDSDMAMSAGAMAEAPREAENLYAQSASSGVSLVYKAARPATIKSDGSESRVPLLSQTLEVAFEYAATPKLSSYAFLKSIVTNGPNDQLMAGRVNIFLDGTYVGASDIAKTIATGEAFELYLGVDEGVVVKRELLEEKSDDTIIGQIPSPTKKISYKYKITAENYKPRTIKLSVFDQVPVAQDDKIRVVKVEALPKPDTDRYKDRQGVQLWTLTLAPKEKKEIVISYVVEYPRDMIVEGL